MGKIKTKFLGVAEVEEKQKREHKEKITQKKIRAQGLKGGARMTQIEVNEDSVKKMEKADKLIKAEPRKKEKTQKKAEKAQVRGQNYQKVKKMVDKNTTYSIKDAVVLLKNMKYVKFDESVELHLNVVNTGLKGEVELPYSTGKTVKVVIVDDKVLANLEKGKMDYDILVTHPSFMPKLARFAKILGPKGLMPNPKAGTISPKPEEVKAKFEKGMLRWKTEAKFPLIHQMIGKLSFEDKKLVENAQAFLKSVGSVNIQKAFIKSTMSPSIKISVE